MTKERTTGAHKSGLKETNLSQIYTRPKFYYQPSEAPSKVELRVLGTTKRPERIKCNFPTAVQDQSFITNPLRHPAK